MTVRERVQCQVRAALGEPEAAVHVEAPKEARFGDLSCNLALVRGGGRALAESLRQRLPQDPAFAEVRVEGPGFLNFLLSTEGVRHVLHQELPRVPRLAAEVPDRVLRAHARAAGLLRMGRDQGKEPEVTEACGLRELVRPLEELPWALRSGDGPRLVACATEIAERFHAWYEGNPLLTGPPEDVRGRLALAEAVQRGLAACCEALGRTAPERM